MGVGTERKSIFKISAKLKTAGICLLTSVTLPVELQAANALIQAGIHYGGDDLVTATFTNGDTEKLKGGGLFTVSAGVGFDVTEKAEARLMAGVKLDTIEAENGSAKFVRFPLEAIYMYRSTEEISVGGGLSYHLNPKVSGDGIASPVGAKFDNALGFVLMLDYALPTNVYFGAKFTKIDYEIQGDSFSGNSIGVTVGYRFK